MGRRYYPELTKCQGLPPRERLKCSNEAVCKYKKKLTPEEAADPVRYPKSVIDGLEIYLCSSCGFLHYGHPPTYLKEKQGA